MSKIEVNTIDAVSGTSTLTLGSSNASTIALGSGDVQSNFLQPSFMAKMSADQSMSDNTLTKVQFDTEVFDTDSKYDHSSNYRFTPTIAGKYFIYAQVHGKSNGNSELEDYRICIQKNGTQIYSTKHNPATNDANQIALNMQIIDTADSDDYYEVFCILNDASGSPTIEHDEGEGVTSYWGAYRIGT